MNHSQNSYWSQNWLSYFWCGGIAIILSWALSGCRFGNHEVDPPSTGPFFYETSLSTIKLCATISGGAPQCVTETNPNFLPNISLTQGANPETGLPSLGQLPDPVELAISTASATTYGIYDPLTGNPFYPVTYDSQNNISFPEGQASIPIFIDTTTDDALCSLTLDLQMNGELTTTGPFTTNIGVPLSGRMPLVIDAVFTPVTQGNGCQQAATCLTTPSACNGNAPSIIASYYQNFLNASGTGVTNGNLANVTSLSYEITYQ
jgi:hypothetical protein